MIFNLKALNLCIMAFGAVSVVSAQMIATNSAVETIYGKFEQFQVEHGREYVDESEKHQRWIQFYDNYVEIERFNVESEKHNSTHRLGINHLMDVFESEHPKNEYEWKSQENGMGGEKITSTQSVPDSVDWRDKNVVTDVKNQGSCGSCWSFSATEAVESAWAISTGELLVLSEQQLVSCDKTDNGCGGGLMDNAFEYIEKNGLTTEDAYPYTAKDGTCNIDSIESAVKICGHTDVKSSSEQALKEALALQPVSVAIQADQLAFRFYKSGVIAQKSCGTKLDHGVLAVGYGTDPVDGDYWLVRNSWGETWGEDGYVRLARTDGTDSDGTCGIAMQASYPVVC